jgi:hypothetical protein
MGGYLGLDIVESMDESADGVVGGIQGLFRWGLVE